MIRLNNNKELWNGVKNSIEKVVELLDARGQLFLKEAKECDLKILPFNSGFFISIPCKNNELVLDKLVEEEKVFLIPIAGCVRVAICSLSLNDIKGLAKKIKTIIDNYDN